MHPQRTLIESAEMISLSEVLERLAGPNIRHWTMNRGLYSRIKRLLVYLRLKKVEQKARQHQVHGEDMIQKHMSYI